MNNILIKNATIITMNNGEIINNAYVLTENDKIKYIGQKEPQVSDYGQLTVIDANGGIVMPATVNMHTHLAMTYFRSYASDLPLDRWLEKIFKIEDRLDEEAIYYGSLLACAEAMEHGTACVNDMYLDANGTARACVDSGIRAYLSRCIVDVDGPDGYLRRAKENENMRLKYDGIDGRINVINSAHAEYTCSPEALKMVYDNARELGVPVHIHISETISEVNGCKLRHNGRTPLQLLKDLGALEHSVTYAAHCVVLDSEDIDIIKKYNIFPIHNPASNLKLGSGVAPVSHMMDHGIDVCLGTDGNGSNNNIDMFREMYLAAILQKGVNRKPEYLNAYQTVEMATVNGAKALGYNGGKIVEGAVADIIILRKTPYLYPQHDLCGMVVYSATGNDVRYNIINGKITVEEGKCITIDKEKTFEAFINICNKLFY